MEFIRINTIILYYMSLLEELYAKVFEGVKSPALKTSDVFQIIPLKVAPLTDNEFEDWLNSGILEDAPDEPDDVVDLKTRYPKKDIEIDIEESDEEPTVQFSASTLKVKKEPKVYAKTPSKKAKK